MKDKKIGYIMWSLLNIFPIILFIIAVFGWRDCYNHMNELEKELVEKKQEVEALKDRTRLLEEDVRDYQDELFQYKQDYYSCKGWIEGDYTYCENGECKNFNEETNKVDYNTYKWLESFYDEFHESVGAYE